MKKIFNLFTGEVIVLISRMLLILYVAHTYGTANVGLYTTLMTWASIISLASLFGGYNIIQKESSNNSIITIVLFLLCVVSFVISSLIAFSLYEEYWFVSITIMASESIGLGVKSISKAISYCDGKLNELAIVNYINSLTYITAFIVLYYFSDGSLIELSLFVMVYNFFTAATYFLAIYKSRVISWFNLYDLRAYIYCAYPYFISSSLRNSFVQLDKIVINLLFGNQVSGVYNLCSRFLTTSTLPVSIYIQSIESKFYLFDKNNQDGLELLISYRKKILLGSLVFSVFSIPVVWFLSNNIGGLEGVIDMYPYFIPMGVITNVVYLYLSYLNAGKTTLRVLSLLLLNSLVLVIITIIFFMAKDKYLYIPIGLSFVMFFILVFINERIKKK